MDNLEPIHTVPDLPRESAEDLPAQPDIRAQLQSFLDRLESLCAKALETEAALQTREQELAAREMQALVHEECEKRGLPPELGSTLVFPTLDAAKKGMDALETAFRAAVRLAVEERLSSGIPKAQKPADTGSMTDAEYYAAMCGIG